MRGVPVLFAGEFCGECAAARRAKCDKSAAGERRSISGRRNRSICRQRRRAGPSQCGEAMTTDAMPPHRDHRPRWAIVTERRDGPHRRRPNGAAPRATRSSVDPRRNAGLPLGRDRRRPGSDPACCRIDLASPRFRRASRRRSLLLAARPRKTVFRPTEIRRRTQTTIWAATGPGGSVRTGSCRTAADFWSDRATTRRRIERWPGVRTFGRDACVCSRYDEAPRRARPRLTSDRRSRRLRPGSPPQSRGSRDRGSPARRGRECT